MSKEKCFACGEKYGEESHSCPPIVDKEKHTHKVHYNGKCLCGFSALSKGESETLEGRLDEELGELKFTDKELCDKIKKFLRAEILSVIESFEKVIKRIKLDVDVIVCDCGEPYKDSDLSISTDDALNKVAELRKRYE